MLHILLCILKILGIFLVSVLGILLLLVLLILFVPIRYRAELVLTEEGQQGDVRVSWLLHGFGIRLRYLEGALSLKARLFWIVSLRLFPANGKKPKNVRKRKNEKQAAEEQKDSPQTAWDAVSEFPDEGKEEIQPQIPALPEPAQETDQEQNPEEEKKRSVFQKMLEWFLWVLRTPIRVYRKIQSFFRNLKYTFHGMYAKINDIRENYNYYMEILKREETKNAFSLCRTQVFRLLAHLMPTKVKGSFRAGTGDPALTGQLYGLYCALWGVHRYQVKVTPDFDQRVLEGCVWMRGRVRIVHILILGLQILFDKNIRYLIKQWKQS